MNLKLILAIWLCVFSFSLLAQDGENSSLTKIDPKLAEQKMKSGNFLEALDDFLSLLEGEPSNPKYLYEVSVCYLNYNGDKTKAIPYLEKLTHLPKYDPNADFLLAQAYHFAHRFDDAINAFNKFKKNGKGSEKNLKDVDHQIQACMNGKELIKFPVNITKENLKIINSDFNEYYAFAPHDESYVVFNSTRPVGHYPKNDNGEYDNHIYISRVNNGEFEKPEILDLKLPKGSRKIEVIGLSGDGKVLLLYLVDVKGVGNIAVSERDEKTNNFKAPYIIDKKINSPHDEIAASINKDGNLIFFASNRPGGYGGTDIYSCRQGPKGTWSEPQNLGPQINTPYDEDFPNISPDEQALYFSSTGHTSMGGYDIFKAILNPETGKFENPKNIGYPINTAYDNYNFTISKNNRYGYISSVCDDGNGDFDLYRIVFNDEEPEYSIIKGQVLSEDGSQINYPDVLITVRQANNKKQIYGNYLANSNTGKYVMILPPGKYILDVELYGFKLKSETLEIKDKVSFKSEIELDLKLQVAR